MAPERPIELHAPAAAIVSGDSHRLRQVLANLLRNALVHTPAATPIEVSVTQDEQSVTVALRAEVSEEAETLAQALGLSANGRTR